MAARGVAYSRFFILIAASGLLATLEPLTAGDSPEGVFDSIAREVHTVFDRCRSAVVRIEARDEHGALAGTGFFIDPDGTIYTSYTIGGDSDAIMVHFENRKVPAERVFSDPRTGVAVLKVEERNTPFLMVGSANSLEVASPVITIGFPMDLPVSPQFGIVGGFDLTHRGRFFATSHIRANLPVQRGEGGAPLLNLKGEVVGIVVSSIDNGPGCFALPIDAAEKVRKDFLRFGEARPGWLGIAVAQAPEVVEGSSVRIDELLPNTPAAESGIQKGDLLLKVGDHPIRTIEDVQNASFYLTSGDPVSIEVLRGGERVQATAITADHPTNRRVAPGPLHGAPLNMRN
jgi:serine protease Do